MGWMKTWLDHHHHSYFKELESAAIIDYRGAVGRGQRQGAAQAGQRL
jgi:hypothetical protein